MGQPISFRESLTKGLRSDSRSDREVGANTTFTNHIPTPYGSRAVEEIEELISAATLSGASITIAMPHPQLFRGGKNVWLVDDDNIYIVTSEENGTISTAKTVHDIYNTGTPSTIASGGGSWHHIDLQAASFFVNNSNVVFHSIWEDPTKFFVEKTSKFTTGCVWNGRVLTAGLNDATYWNADWLARFQSLYATGSGSWGLEMSQPEVNFICWGPMGTSGLVNLFLPDEIFNDGDIGSVSGGHSASDPIFRDMVQRGDWGFMPVEWVGEILMLKPMRKGVVVYGDSRISALVPSSAGGIPGFGLIEQTHGIGLNSRSSVGGGLDEHLFLDNQGSLWLMDGNFNVTKAGGEGTESYREFLNTFQGEDILIHYDRDMDAYYICGETLTYRWTRRDGLAKMGQVCTGAYQFGGAFAGIVKDGQVPDVVTLQLPIFRAPSVGRVELVDRDASATNATAFLSYRNNQVDSFTVGSGIEVDDNGVAVFNRTAFEYRIKITHPTKISLKLDDVLAHPIEGGKTGLKTVLDA